jgi:hypothetical protein
MRYTYYFKDTTDVIISDPLTRNEYDQFITEFKELNSKYNFEVYLTGGYISFLVGETKTYGDIDFLVMAEKIMDLDELTEFFKGFHQLAKKYKFAYDLLYFMDATAEDLNMDPTNQHILAIEQTRTLKLYHKKVDENNISVGNDQISGIPVTDTELFEGMFSDRTPTRKFIKKTQTRRFFQKPIKIS